MERENIMDLEFEIEQLKEKILKFIDNFSLAQVGSSIKNDNFYDIDLLFVVDDKVNGLFRLSECFADYNISISDDAFKILNLYQHEISVAVYSFIEIEQIVYNYITGKKVVCEHRSWAIGYWICEGFIYDLQNCKILYDSNDRLETIKRNLMGKSLYGEKKILLDCLEEIEIKQQLLLKQQNIIQNCLLKNDIVLAMIRSCYVLCDYHLKSFKNMSKIVENLPSKYKNIITEYIGNGDDIFLQNIKNEILNRIDFTTNLYLGTWQFSGDFKQFSDEQIIKLISYAKELGIKQFDTALVYGGGKVEKLLSKVIDDSDKIVTKIPAKVKPKVGFISDLKEYYDFEYIKKCLNTSLSNLKRKKIDILLLHNWVKEWNNSTDLIDWLTSLKQFGYVDKVGISLPNGYGECLPDYILKKIDVIEAPYNPNNLWIVKDIDKYKENNVEIILRSLFMQGQLLKDDVQKYSSILNKAKLFGTSLVIGMTTESQMNNNIRVLKR